MDLNFADLKKEAAATRPEDIFSHTTEVAKQAASDFPHDLLESLGAGAGPQDDNAHTEHYFANEQKDLDFEHVDPQTFVQRMSAGAKEAQEQLDAKFAQQNQQFNDFFGQGQGLEPMGGKFDQAINHGMAALTNDFMNAERGVFGEIGEDLTKSAAQSPPVKQDADLMSMTSDISNDGFAPSAPSAPMSNFYEDEFGVPSFTAKASTSTSKDSDTDSTSVSYNPSPAKKNPVTDALKEQNNEKFISFENLLGDFKEERTSTPDFQAAVAPAANAGAIHKPTAAAAIPTTDLDADDDFDPLAAHSHAESVRDVPAAPAPVAKPPSEPVKAISAPRAAPPAPPTAAAKESKPAAGSYSFQQPSLVSVEEIFYKYGLDAWFKPERLHPQVESLIYWRDVKRSGIVFGAGIIVLLAISCFSVISVFAYLSLILLFAAIAFRIYKSVMQAVQKTSDAHPFQEYLDIDLTLSQDKIKDVASVTVAHVNGFTAELRRLFLVEDLVDSLKFAVILWVMTYIGAWFNGMTLVILAFISLFTLPKVYENNKASIDTYLDLVRSKLTEITDKIKVAIPIGKKVAADGESDKDK